MILGFGHLAGAIINKATISKDNPSQTSDSGCLVWALVTVGGLFLWWQGAKLLDALFDFGFDKF